MKETSCVPLAVLTDRSWLHGFMVSAARVSVGFRQVKVLLGDPRTPAASASIFVCWGSGLRFEFSV